MADTYEFVDSGSYIRMTIKKDTVVQRVVDFNKTNTTFTAGVIENTFSITDLKASYNIKNEEVTIPDLANALLVVDALKAFTAEGSGGALNNVTFAAAVELTVTDAGTIKIPANPSRKALIVSVSNDNDVWYRWGSAAVVEKTIQLKKNESDVWASDVISTQDLFLITKSTLTSKVYFQEGT